jgi:hypothetical protein
MAVRLVSVNGVRSRRAGVLAFVDGVRVRWDPHTGWACACADPACPHVAAVKAVIDPRITGGDDARPDR